MIRRRHMCKGDAHGNACNHGVNGGPARPHWGLKLTPRDGEPPKKLQKTLCRACTLSHPGEWTSYDSGSDPARMCGYREDNLEEKEKSSKRAREYYQRPDVNEHRREYQREYSQRPEV